MILPVYCPKARAFFWEMDGNPKARERMSPATFLVLKEAVEKAQRSFITHEMFEPEGILKAENDSYTANSGVDG